MKRIAFGLLLATLALPAFAGEKHNPAQIQICDTLEHWNIYTQMANDRGDSCVGSTAGYCESRERLARQMQQLCRAEKDRTGRWPDCCTIGRSYDPQERERRVTDWKRDREAAAVRNKEIGTMWPAQRAAPCYEWYNRTSMWLQACIDGQVPEPTFKPAHGPFSSDY